MEVQPVFAFAKESGVFGPVHLHQHRLTLCTDGPAPGPIHVPEHCSHGVQGIFIERPDLSVFALFFWFAATTAGLSSQAISRGTPLAGHELLLT